MSGKLPLSGLTVIEFAGLAPGPYAGLILADWGARVIRIDRVNTSHSPDILCRGKLSLAVNPKIPEGRDLLLKLIEGADVLIDPFRPGVLERLAFGPDVFLGEGGKNERLVYARVMGFPPDSPQGNMAGHDINYLAMSGVLSMLPGTPDCPSFPLNLLADFAGGGLLCALGILVALYARTSTGKGQVVSTDMVSGARYVSSFPLLHTLLPNGSPYFGIGPDRGTKILDGGAPFYGAYPCKDGKCMSVGCLEPQFFEAFITRFVGALPECALDGGWKPSPETQTNVNDWPRLREYLERGFRTKTRDEWAEIFAGTDACALPVLEPAEAAKVASSSIPVRHPNLSSAVLPNTSVQPALSLQLRPGEHTEQILRSLNLSPAELRNLVSSGALGERAKAKL